MILMIKVKPLNSEYQKTVTIVEEHLKTYFCSAENVYEEKFNEIMNYSLLSGGKRLRPVLLYKVAEIFEGDMNVAIEMACALEMIHTYSLIHDDLPAMDNDDYRRGNLTSHKKYSESMAILAGDGLLNKAYEVLFDAIIDNDADKNAIMAMQYIAKSAGYKGMIGGQVVDVETENQNIDTGLLDYIIQNKTAKLIMAAIVSGALLGKIDEEEKTKIEKAAFHIGYSFQLTDDALDVTGNLDTIGKTPGRDLEMGKNTYVKYYGLTQTIDDSKNHLEQATYLLDSLNRENLDFIYDIIKFLKYREK